MNQLIKIKPNTEFSVDARELHRFLESKNLIVKEQSGFRNKRGTADNLLFMSQKIRECILRDRMVCGIYFDISKAFDKVWHDGLIYKMICLGVPLYMVKWQGKVSYQNRISISIFFI